MIDVNMVNERIDIAWHKQGGAVRTNNGSTYRSGKLRQGHAEGELFPWVVGMVVIFAASAVCWALIYAVFISSYHFLSGSH
jgi:hypothetical protein